MEDTKLQLMEGLLGQPSPASPRPDPPRTMSSEVVQQPGSGINKCQQPPETQPPEEIPPEAVREYMEIMDWLETHLPLATGKPSLNQKEDRLVQEQGEDRMYPDLLSYCDELCSQEDFITKVEAIIHPQFLAAALSTDAKRDIVAITQALEQEERCSPDQVQKRKTMTLTMGQHSPPPPPSSMAFQAQKRYRATEDQQPRPRTLLPLQTSQASPIEGLLAQHSSLRLQHSLQEPGT